MTGTVLPFPEDEGIDFVASYVEQPQTDDPEKKGVHVWYWDDLPEKYKKFIKYQEYVDMVAVVSPWFDSRYWVQWLEMLGPWHTRKYPCPDGVIYVGYKDRQPEEEL